MFFCSQITWLEGDSTASITLLNTYRIAVMEHAPLLFRLTDLDAAVKASRSQLEGLPVGVILLWCVSSKIEKLPAGAVCATV